MILVMPILATVIGSTLLAIGLVNRAEANAWVPLLLGSVLTICGIVSIVSIVRGAVKR